MDIVDQTAEYYGQRAPWHDEYMGWRGTDRMAELLESLVAWVVPHMKNRDVLELACGTGNWTAVLARWANRVLATDLNSSMLRIARAKLTGIERVQFRELDAYAPEGALGDFDAAFAADWFSHVPHSRLGSFLDRLHAVLGNSARVVFVDILYHDHPDLRPCRRDGEGNTYCRRRLPDGREFEVLKNYPERAEILELLGGRTEDLRYEAFGDLRRWALSYRTS